ncbi:SpaH/EbpB family LPXTG-anchored major pilin [Brevibacterium sp. 2SA]|uniref:SpaH/EbpB family LPXTG-anchored major pilin n=1 Tax=Brevibacterium sp. 2SA TaxID=2502198 RepID=UPI0010FA37FE|nr:SpaH/EbpB family LPXTG-anchored major pilin [Brevibacterium sp. 2SA]
MRANLFKRVRWIPALAAAAALSLAGITAPAPAEAAAGNINPNTPSSLTINKYDGDQGPRGDGTKIDDTSNLGSPLAGVEFTITPITQKGGQAIDLDTDAGWNLIDGATVADVKGGGYTRGTPQTVTTDANGTVTADLPHGFYLVEETGTGSNNVISPAEPFLVTLPLPQTGGKWLYDVNVYPKNKTNQTKPKKEVSAPTGMEIGNDVTWTITSPVPPIAKDDTYKSFTITDSLDPRLTCKSITVEGFTAGTDYTVDCSGQTANVEFTSAGVAKLQAGQEIKTRIVTTVNSLGDNGAITNEAIVTTNGSKVTTNPAQTNWGRLEILKIADNDQAATLAGAVFEIYEDRNGEPIGELTTGADGRATIRLWVGNNDVTAKDYWLRETRAPAGYTLPQDPWTGPVSVKVGGESNPVTVDISNKQKDRGELPFTGANGQLMAMIIGIALLLLAVGAAVMRYTRRARQN